MTMLLFALALFSHDVRGAFDADRDAKFALGGVDTITTSMGGIYGSMTARLTSIGPRDSLRMFPDGSTVGLTIGAGNIFQVTMKRRWLLWLEGATPKDSASAAGTYNFAPGRYTHHWRFAEIDSSRGWVRWVDTLRQRNDSTSRIPLLTILSTSKIDSIVPANGADRARITILTDAGVPVSGPTTLARGQNLRAEIAPGGYVPASLWRIHIDGAPRDSFLVGGLPIVSVHRPTPIPKAPWKSFDALGRHRPGTSFAPLLRMLGP